MRGALPAVARAAGKGACEARGTRCDRNRHWALGIRHWKTAGLLTLAAALLAADGIGAQERPAGQGFSFRTGVELVNVTVTVTDERGRFVPDLKQDDFVVYEDGKPQTISQFDSERVPVSLGVALDTSGSMIGEKIAAAQAALNRFLFDLLGRAGRSVPLSLRQPAELVQGWTENRAAGGAGARHGEAVGRHGDLRRGRRRRCRWRSRARGARRRSS